MTALTKEYFTNQLSKSARRLENKFSIYVPSKDKNDNPIDNAEYIEFFKDFLSSVAGGATVTTAEGVWASELQYTTEPIVVISSFIDFDELGKNLDQLINHVKRMGRILRQETIGFEFNNDFYIVDDFSVTPQLTVIDGGAISDDAPLPSKEERNHALALLLSGEITKDEYKKRIGK